MDKRTEAPALMRLALAGLLALGAAMGVGRFAATPLLPMMQQSQGLSLAQGAWMATANYGGYLVGALIALVATPAPGRTVRGGLVTVLLVTAAMAVTDNVALWYLLRFLAGVASALVLVGVSGTAVSVLGASSRPELTGLAFAGVGAGSAAAGLIAMLTALAGWGAPLAWSLLAVAVAAVLLASWSAWGGAAGMSRSAGPAASSAPAPARASAVEPVASPRATLGRQAWILIAAYGVFGLGYIVPATFLPAMARERFADPLIYGWFWPLFGLAAAVSTVLTTWRFRRVAPQTVFIVSLLIMAVGVVAPLFGRSLVTLLLSALCVGGSFMVATMTGLSRARQLVDGPPFRLIAAMTAAFAAGQLCGPALVALGAGRADPIVMPSLVSGVLLLASAALVQVGGAAGRRRNLESRQENTGEQGG